MSAKPEEFRGAGGDDVTLRRATLADLNSVRGLLSVSGLPLDGVSDHVEDFVIAEAGGDLAGVIGMERHGAYGLLRSAAVREDLKSCGIGGKLVNQLLASARQHGVTDVYLLTTTAERYFPAFGFSVIPRSAVPGELSASAEFQGACPDTATVMHLPLSSNRSSHGE